MNTISLTLTALAALAAASASLADSTQARCDIYPKGEDHASASLDCTFSQRQGHVVISREDGVTHDLVPVDDVAGNFRDQQGNAVYRESGLGSAGLIFRLPGESVYVYWMTTAMNTDADKDSPTYPYSTDDYDATTLLPCRTGEQAGFGSCPAGIARMEGGEASITLTSPAGEEFTINFMRDYVNATGGREVKAALEGDLWTVEINGGAEVYRVPLQAIEGG